MKNMAGIMLLPVFMTPCFAAPPHWCIHAVRLENRPLMLGKTTAEDIAKAFGHAAEFDASDSAPPSVCYRSGGFSDIFLSARRQAHAAEGGQHFRFAACAMERGLLPCLAAKCAAAAGWESHRHDCGK